MTIEEAIDRLERRYMTMSMGFIGDEGKEICKRENEAITMAINALRGHNLMKPAEEPLTNADRIRAMSDDELAEWLGDMIFPQCLACPATDEPWCLDRDCFTVMLAWLRTRADGGADSDPT